jgi:actin-related protein 6
MVGPEMIEIPLSKELVVPANSRPTYSQLSFTIFRLCIEAHTGKNYSQTMGETIYKQLNLINSGVSPGDTGRAAIPPGESSWGSDYRLNVPVSRSSPSHPAK